MKIEYFELQARIEGPSQSLRHCYSTSAYGMPVTTILLLRHGHRIAWTLDPTTGKYSSNHPYPTRLPADPPLASHGVRQAHEAARYLSCLLRDEIRQDRLRIYSSLFYRCSETLRPYIEKVKAELQDEGRDAGAEKLLVRGESGFGEWFGKALFEQPVAPTKEQLKQDFFPWIDADYESKVLPDRHGENIVEIHDRVARVFEEVVEDVDEEYRRMGRSDEEITILIAGHAAQIICSGRVLTGKMPADPDEEDFKCYTCGVSRFVRRKNEPSSHGSDWRRNGGVVGGWDCILNSYCGFLTQGEERGWHFHGDEAFDSYGPNSGPITSDGSIEETKVEDTRDKTSKL